MKTTKRFMAGGFGALLVLMLVAGGALAGTETMTRQHSTLVQGDPYYWVKCEQERLGLCVYAGTEAEAGFRLQVAQERLDEAVQLMEQSRFAEADAALEQYRVQIQAMNQAMVKVRERAAAESAGNSEMDNRDRNGWLDPGEVMLRIEQRTRAQLQVLDQLCDGTQEQAREQVRLALEECTSTCTQLQAGQSDSAPTNSDSPSDSAVQEQNRTQEQNQGEDQVQVQEQNQTQEQQQETTEGADEQAPQGQNSAPGPGEPQSQQGR